MEAALKAQPGNDDQELACCVGAILDIHGDKGTYRPEAVCIILQAVRLAAAGQGDGYGSFIRQSQDDLWQRWWGSSAA